MKAGYRTGSCPAWYSVGSQAYISRGYFTVFSGTRILITYKDMEFEYRFAEMFPQHLYQFGTIGKKAKFISIDSPIFKRVLKHCEFLLNHYDTKEIERLRFLQFSLPLV